MNSAELEERLGSERLQAKDGVSPECYSADVTLV